MAGHSEQDQRTYMHMQARLIDLLLKHNQPGFHDILEEYTEYAPYYDDTDSSFGFHRDVAVLFHLSYELFDHILPRIKHGLSFHTPRTSSVEEPPVHGAIDWERTMEKTWEERPGEPPLDLLTRRRLRDFETPENLLTVTTLLEYHADVKRILSRYALFSQAEVLFHPLQEAAEKCDREMNFSQFRDMKSLAQRIVEGEHGGTELLESKVADHLIPGSNNAYEDLLEWRKRWRSLRLLNRTYSYEANNVLGADPRREDILYHVWLFFELLDFLQSKEAIHQSNVTPGQMFLQFGWGEDGSQCVYTLRYDQHVTDIVAGWQSSTTGETAGERRMLHVRPSFTLHRIEPAPTQVEKDGVCYWRESGMVWRGIYNLRQYATANIPFQQIIADLSLLGESYGMLLYASGSSNVLPFTLSPAEHHPTAAPQRVESKSLSPRSDADMNAFHEELVSLLDSIHEQLCEPPELTCQGVFLDTASLDEAKNLLLFDRGGNLLSDKEQLKNLLICPKPHIGPWRVDVVNREQHCCKDGAICHMVGYPDVQPPIRPPRTVEQLLEELEHILGQDEDQRPEDLTDEYIQKTAQRIEALTKQYATFTGFHTQIEVYRNRVKDLGMRETFDLLSNKDYQDSLALAAFLLEKLDSIIPNAGDYSAPTIHISGVLEAEVQKRIFAPCQEKLSPGLSKHYQQTLGKLRFIKQNNVKSEYKRQENAADWKVIEELAKGYWRPDLGQDDPNLHISFANFVYALGAASDIRNKAAHSNKVSRGVYGRFQDEMLLRNPILSGFGLLNALLLGWPMVPPASASDKHDDKRDDTRDSSTDERLDPRE